MARLWNAGALKLTCEWTNEWTNEIIPTWTIQLSIYAITYSGERMWISDPFRPPYIMELRGVCFLPYDKICSTMLVTLQSKNSLRPADRKFCGHSDHRAMRDSAFRLLYNYHKPDFFWLIHHISPLIRLREQPVHNLCACISYTNHPRQY